MSQEKTPLIGFIGLGKMGIEMAKNIIEGTPCKVMVYNRTASKAESLVSCGATAVKDPKELAAVDVLFTMLASDAVVEACVVHSGLLEEMRTYREGREADGLYPIHVSCSTLSAAFVEEQVKRHTEHGVRYVAMPVCGRPDAAAARKLHLLLAGEEEAVESLRPLLVPIIGQSIRYYGADPVKANVMKIAFNFTLASAIETISEGSSLVQRYGIETEDFTSLLSDTLFNCVAYNGYGRLIASRQFLPAGATLEGVGAKDVGLALKAGEKVSCPLPFASVMRDHMMEGMASGMAEWDWSCVAVVAEHHAGINKPVNNK